MTVEVLLNDVRSEQCVAFPVKQNRLIPLSIYPTFSFLSGDVYITSSGFSQSAFMQIKGILFTLWW